VRRTFPVGWVESDAFDLDKEFIIADFWDRLSLYGNGFGLGSSLVLEVARRRK